MELPRSTSWSLGRKAYSDRGDEGSPNRNRASIQTLDGDVYFLILRVLSRVAFTTTVYRRYSSSFFSPVADFHPSVQIQGCQGCEHSEHPQGSALIGLGLHAIAGQSASGVISIGTTRAMAQIKPANSRAIAVMIRL